MATLCGFHSLLIFGRVSRSTLARFPRHFIYRNYSRRLKGKRQQVAKDGIDIEGILKGSPAISSASSPPASKVVNESENDERIKNWQVSEQRTNLLKQGEKRVAIIAVVTMLVGFVAIKAMVFVTEKRRKTKEEAVEQPAQQTHPG
ncbi:uncharacterized protein LOC122948353 [Acropora millepora]|uniref:uncharacterized protein LOC122948353 n=1 Tax=Acropora millepora TaxID=45264 RepID=UPI001CF1B61B|nr:uncharacterized protein LOC122948353 [Acropora millepora]